MKPDSVAREMVARFPDDWMVAVVAVIAALSSKVEGSLEGQ